MQTVEAMISFLFFVAIATPMLLQLEAQHDVDDSPYRMQLAEDAWRVLCLRGTLHNITNESTGSVERELSAVGDETGLCMFIDGVRFTNCRDGRKRTITASLRKTVFYDGTPQGVTFSIGR